MRAARPGRRRRSLSPNGGGRERGTGVILAYHRIASVKPDPHGLCVSPRHFAEHLEVLAGAYAPVSVREMGEALRGGGMPPGAVAVTFDDGYADNLLEAEPLLESHRVPAAFFISLGFVERQQEFWWDELERCLLEAPVLPSTLEVGLGSRTHAWELGASRTLEEGVPSDLDWQVGVQRPPTGRHQAYLDLHAALRPLSPAERETVLSQLRSQAQLEEAPAREDHRPLTPDELARLDAGPYSEVGVHSSNHPVLANLSLGAQEEEIGGTKERMEEALGRPVDLFAYPYGGRRDYTAGTTKLVRKAGFAAACAAFPGVVSSATSPYELPRFLVFDWNGEAFRRRLEGFFRTRRSSWVSRWRGRG